MIPLAELPTSDGVYVIHFDAPLAHAHGYVGWAADIARRVAEHLDVEACRRAGFHVASHRGSPLVCAAIRARRSVQVAQVYPGGDRRLERRLHHRHHPRICILCKAQRPPRPRQTRLPFETCQPAPPRRAGAPHSGGSPMRSEQVQVRTMRVRYRRQCAHCHGGIEPGAFLVVVVYPAVGTVRYCLPCAVALRVPRPQAQATEG